MMSKSNNVAVLGEGSFGTAIACLLADCGMSVHLWCYDPNVVHKIHEARVNERYMPGVCLVERIRPTADLELALAGKDLVFIATPVEHLRSVLEKALPSYRDEQVWVVLSKGIERESLMLPTQVVEDVFGENCKVAVMSGPSFAYEVGCKQYTQVMVAARTAELTTFLDELITAEYFGTEPSQDMMGIQMCAAYKNVVALGMGILQGAGFGENARALFLTKALHEMAGLVDVIGGDPQTAGSLAGVGDLVLTAYGTQSRNVTLGIKIGKGERLADIKISSPLLPEGVNTVYALHEFIQDAELGEALIQVIYGILEGKNSPVDLVNVCMEQH